MLTSRHKAQLIIMTAFILGVAVGASGQYLLSRQSAPRRPPSVAEATDELTRVLKLDQSQQSRVRQILGESRQQSHQQQLTIRDNTRKRIHDLLSAEQQTSYDQWTKDLDAKREREKKKPEGGK
jgi:hypothetical protein